jgi:hypothetical protein
VLPQLLAEPVQKCAVVYDPYYQGDYFADEQNAV